MRGRGDDRLGVHHETELARGSVLEWVGVRGCLPSRHPWLRAKLEAAQPFHVRASFPSGKHEPERVALRRTKRLAVLCPGEDRVIHQLFDRNATREETRITALGERPPRAGRKP